MDENQNNQTAGATDPGEQANQGGVPAEVSAAAAALGRRNRGKPRRVSPDRREQLVEQAKKMTARRRAVSQGRVVSVGAGGEGAVVRSAPRVVQAGRVVSSGRVIARPRIVAATPGDVRRFG